MPSGGVPHAHSQPQHVQRPLHRRHHPRRFRPAHPMRHLHRNHPHVAQPGRFHLPGRPLDRTFERGRAAQAVPDVVTQVRQPVVTLRIGQRRVNQLVRRGPVLGRQIRIRGHTTARQGEKENGKSEPSEPGHKATLSHERQVCRDALLVALERLPEPRGQQTVLAPHPNLRADREQHQRHRHPRTMASGPAAWPPESPAAKRRSDAAPSGTARWSRAYDLRKAPPARGIAVPGASPPSMPAPVPEAPPACCRSGARYPAAPPDRGASRRPERSQYLAARSPRTSGPAV